MKERPILFSGPMVRAILDGRKTQTRRIVKKASHPVTNEVASSVNKDGSGLGWIAWFPGPMTDEQTSRCYPGEDGFKCPYGQLGDRLWVRETWQYIDWTEDGEPYIAYAADGRNILKRPSEEWSEKVQDIWEDLSAYENYKIERRASDKRWRPSIFMPRWASRITLEITGIRVERLHEISEKDAIKEGFQPSGFCCNGNECGCMGLPIEPARVGFMNTWEAINGTKSWDANHWVWVIEFKPVSKLFPDNKMSEKSSAISDK